MRGLTQDALARAAGVSKITVLRIEHGHTNGIDFGVLDRLCRALEIEPAQLFTRYQIRGYRSVRLTQVRRGNGVAPTEIVD